MSFECDYRIVNLIGHEVTDEPPHALVELAAAQARAEAAEAKIAAVLALCDAVAEASLRPAHPDYEPIEVPWTVAVRRVLGGDAARPEAEQ